MAHRQTWRRWGTDCVLVTTDRAASAEARRICDRVMDGVDAAISTWRDDSELVRLRAGWNDVSPTLAGALAAALWAAELSEGAVDPTLGEAVAAWRHSLEPTTRLRSPWREVEVDDLRVRIPAGAALDLGAIGKAYAADLVARQAAAATGAGVLVGLGGDLATGGPGPVTGWQVLVQDVRTDPPHVVTLHDGMAIATSSTLHRQRHAGDPDSAHLLDPRTGAPVHSPWRTATAVAPTCVEANAHATAAIVLGRRARPWLDRHPVPARLVDRAGRVTSLGGFPAEVAA